MTTATPRTALLDLLARTAFRLGNFTLSSGAMSDYYIDCRTTTLHAAGGRLTMGADPVVSAIAIASAWQAQQSPGAPLIQGFLVRKAEKTHGTGRRIEGFCEKDAPVLIVDDVCTTGASTIIAIEAAREGGMRVIAAICLVERQEAGGRAALEAACQGAPFLRLFTANDVCAAHIRQLSPP